MGGHSGPVRLPHPCCYSDHATCYSTMRRTDSLLTTRTALAGWLATCGTAVSGRGTLAACEKGKNFRASPPVRCASKRGRGSVDRRVICSHSARGPRRALAIQRVRVSGTERGRVGPRHRAEWDRPGRRVDRSAATTVDRQHPHQDAPEGVSNDVAIHANELAGCHPFPNDSLDDVVQFVRRLAHGAKSDAAMTSSVCRAS